MFDFLEYKLWGPKGVMSVIFSKGSFVLIVKVDAAYQSRKSRVGIG